uniref:Collectin-10 n=1 Tax=Magallana gigas TaxID=29159 RepID=K1Q6M3_MAGGI
MKNAKSQLLLLIIAFWASSEGYGFGVWLGLTDLQREGQYVAMSDARRPRYSNWVRGEPNNGNRQEHCAMYWIARRGWNDTVCTGRMNYIYLRLPDDLKIGNIENIVNLILLMTQSCLLKPRSLHNTVY